MTRKLIIKTKEFNVPNFIHRKFKHEAWAVVLPGYECRFSDEENKSSMKSFIKACEHLEGVLCLEENTLLKNTVLHVDISLVGGQYNCKIDLGQQSFVFVYANNQEVAKDIFNTTKGVNISDPKAKIILGEKQWAKLMVDWISYLKTFVAILNISKETKVTLITPEKKYKTDCIPIAINKKSEPSSLLTMKTTKPRSAVNLVGTNRYINQSFWWNEDK